VKWQCCAYEESVWIMETHSRLDGVRIMLVISDVYDRRAKEKLLTPGAVDWPQDTGLANRPFHI